MEKKTVNYRCNKNVKAWNTHGLHADNNCNPPLKELTQFGNDSTFTVEITYSAAEAGWNDYITISFSGIGSKAKIERRESVQTNP